MRLIALATITLALSVLGLAGAILAGTRHGAATPGLAVVFASVALRQALLLQGGDPSHSETLATAAELAMLCAAAGGLLALRSLLRTTRERDRVEDLHWDSMEAVRAISELAARPAADISLKLRAALELGAARFDLPAGVIWREGAGPDGDLLAQLAPKGYAESRPAWLADLLPRLREAARAPRPVVLLGGGEHRVVFAGPLAAGGARGALAFAGSRAGGDRFTASDKDLLGLMAVWLAGELERGTPARATDELEQRAPAEPSDPLDDRATAAAAAAQPNDPPQPIPLAPRRRRLHRDRDLNGAVRRAERGLRRQIGADATLEIALAEDLPPVAGARLPLATLVESVVLAAARLAPAGRIRVETTPPAHAGPASRDRGGDVTLCASVTGDVDAAALERIFDPPDDAGTGVRGTVSLGRLEQLLRRAGGDLSVAVEPGRRAMLTAYLPAADPARRSAAASARRAAPAARADQPSR